MHMRTVAIAVVSFILGTISIGVAYAWSGPTAAPPGNNVAAPINVGSTDQVKNGGLGLNSLAVFGDSLFGGSAGSNAYMNFGVTSGSSGYGIRDNAGTLEFKNDGGSWDSLQAIVYNLVGGAAWATNGNKISNTNTGNVGIGTTNPSKKLDVQGDINVSGNQYVNGVKAYLFGGLYVTASVYCPAINNALTGGQSCPSGFTAQLVFGALCNASDPSVRSIYMCVK
jgi:hypothetical protein